MRNFPGRVVLHRSELRTVDVRERMDEKVPHHSSLSIRFALYEDAGVPPRIVHQNANDCSSFLDVVPTMAYDYHRQLGGELPYTVICEVVENLIHANFREPVISVFAPGDTIRVSDSGVGIDDVARAIQPGYTTATSTMKRWIRGVGSGLPVARECMARIGGTLAIESNLGKGTVVTVSTNRGCPDSGSGIGTCTGEDRRSRDTHIDVQPAELSERQKRVLLFLAELDYVGPSTLADNVGLTLSTAHRELGRLEAMGLVQMLKNGKRRITEIGLARVRDLFEPSGLRQLDGQHILFRCSDGS